MTTWYIGAGAAALVALVGLIFIAKGVGSSSGEASVKNLFTVKGSAAFMVFALGFGASAYSFHHAAKDEQGERDSRARVGKITGISGAKSYAALRNETGGTPTKREFGIWLKGFFEARVEVDMGKEDGVESGDYLATVRPGVKVDELRESDIGTLGSETSALLKVADASEDHSTVRLDGFGINAFVARLDQGGQGPVERGQRVVLVPREEKDASDRIAEEADRVGDDPKSARTRHLEVLRLSEAFFIEHPGAYFTPRILFLRGDSQEALGRRDEAIATFELFLKRFPFDPSHDGAVERLKDWGVSSSFQ